MVLCSALCAYLTFSCTDTTPLWIASANGHASAVSALLGVGAKVDARASDGSTPLYQAAKWNKPQVLKELLKAVPPPDVNAKNEKDSGATPLYIACNAEVR